MTKQLQASDTFCNEKDGKHYCCGQLWRAGDGADRLSERLGRIILVCLKCGTRKSLPVK